MSTSAPPAFTARGGLSLVIAAAVLFVAMLWLVGNRGLPSDPTAGHGHGGAVGLDGYAGLAKLLEADGHPVTLARGAASLDGPGLLVLTPPQAGPASDIQRIVMHHLQTGPVLVIAPKWQAAPEADNPAARKGWVRIGAPSPPDWPGFRDDVNVHMGQLPAGQTGWRGAGVAGRLPDRVVESGESQKFVPLVTTEADGRMLAGYATEGATPALAALAIGGAGAPDKAAQARYPLVMVFEPDLVDNWGLAAPENALWALRLARALAGERGPVTFDLTLAGFGHERSLLGQLTEVPMLAASLCLLAAALAAIWRGALRFGAPTVVAGGPAPGKAALVALSAGLLLRAGRFALVGEHYAALVRARLARELGLPARASAAEVDALLDRALAMNAAGAEAHAFSAAVARLGAARRPLALLSAARALHALRGTLTR